MKAIPPIPGVKPYGMTDVLATSDHTLFAFVSDQQSVDGIWQYKQGHWTKFTGPGLLAYSGVGVYVDSQDRLWTGLRDEVGLPS